IPSLNVDSVRLDQTDITRPAEGLCQVRLTVYKKISQSQSPPPNIWWVGDHPGELERVLGDVIERINGRALPFFGRFEDADELLRAFLEEDGDFGPEEIWEFGRKGSPVRMFYTGFCALECHRWDLAFETLTQCREKAVTIYWKDRHDILACIEAGIE